MKDGRGIALTLLVLVVIMSNTQHVEWGTGWHWPVPDLDMPDGTRYPATVSQELHAGHAGVDIDYHRRTSTDRPEYPAGSVNGTPRYFAVPGTPVVAARAGQVWSVSKTPRGWSVVIDHGKPFCTFYQHLETVALPITRSGRAVNGGITRVVAGQQLGTMGWDPTDAERFRHLHFAVWYRGAGDAASVDPQSNMPQWTRSRWRLTT